MLNSILIYQLSFYRLPKKSLKTLISLQHNFLWGGNEINSKIAWLSWKKLCMPKSGGGLGVRDLDVFNKVLITKWLWRLLSDQEALWVRVVKSIYGSVRLVGGRPRCWSGWWRGVIENGMGEKGKWFWQELERKLGDGGDTSFWHYLWLTDLPLKDKFSRLFNLSKDKEVVVGTMGSWVNNIWPWNCSWRRPLLAREEAMVDSLFQCILQVRPKQSVKDNLSWKGSKDGIFNTRCAYSKLNITAASDQFLGMRKSSKNCGIVLLRSRPRRLLGRSFGGGFLPEIT